MRRFLFLLYVCLLTALPSFSQSTTITATHIAQDITGTLLEDGQLCLTPVSSIGMPTAFVVNGVQYQPQTACFDVSNGALSGVSVPDTSMSSPAIGYRVTVQSASGDYSYPQPAYPQGATWSFDSFSPTQTVTIDNPATLSAGANAPQGRCGTKPAIYFNATDTWHCFNQVWVHVTSSSGGSAFVGGTLTSPLYLSEDPLSNMEAATKHYVDQAIAAIPGVTSTQINTAIGGPAATQSYVSTAIASIPTVTQTSVLNAIGYTPLSINDLADLLPLSGGTLTGTLNLSDGSAAASQTWVDAEIASKLSGVSGGGGSGTTVLPTGIGTVNRTGVLTTGTIAYKTCYVGSSVCSGGVGSNAPSSTPQRVTGLATPNAGTGTSNAVASYSLSTQYASPQFTDVLWTTTGGGLGIDSSSTNWYRDFWMKAAFPAGHTHFEFDTYAFDDGWDWMWGVQCNATKNIIQIDNQTNGWVDTSVPCGILFDGNYHHIQQTFHRDLAANHNCAGNTAPCEWFDDIAIDGTLYVISKSLPATTSSWTGSGGQIQLDTSPSSASSGSPAMATVYIDTDTVTAGLADTSGTTNPGGNGGTTSGTGELASFSFDSGSLPSGTGISTVGTPTISTSNYHTSPDSALFPAGNNYIQATLANPTNVVYSRQYVYISSIGSNSNSFLRLYHGTAELMSFYLSASTGNPSYFDQASNSGGTMSSTPLSTGTVHLIEIYTKIDPTAGQVICKIDGTTVFTSAATLNTGTSSVDTVWFGQIGGTAPVGWGITYQDNVDFSAAGWIGPI